MYPTNNGNPQPLGRTNTFNPAGTAPQRNHTVQGRSKRDEFDPYAPLPRAVPNSMANSAPLQPSRIAEWIDAHANAPPPPSTEYAQLQRTGTFAPGYANSTSQRRSADAGDPRRLSTTTSPSGSPPSGSPPDSGGKQAFQQPLNPFYSPQDNQKYAEPQKPESSVRASFVPTPRIVEPPAAAVDDPDKIQRDIERLEAAISSYKSWNAYIEAQEALFAEMFRLSQQETQRNIELTEQVNLLHRAMQLNELRTFLHDRDLQIGRLNDLEALQQVAIHHIQQTIEVEREGYLEATQMDAQFKKALTKLLREEEAMMSGLYEAKAGKKKVEELLKQALDTSKRSLVDLEALKQEVAQKLKNYEDARKKLRDKQAMVFDQMGGTTMQLLQLLVQVLTTLKIKVRKRKEWIERRLRAEEKRNQALNWDEDLEIDKLVPEWDNPNFAWPRVCEMALETYVPPAKLPPFMTAMLTASGWVELGIQCQRTVETVRMMSRPFGNGSYRLAFYALGSSGMRYTVKQFKQPAENDAADWDYGLKTGLLHAFSWTAAQFFSAACRKCHPPLHIDISYVPSYVARNLSDNNRVYMVEPLLPDFQKWTNNDTFISESVEGDIMAAFTHFTLHYSEGNFMITDLQGFCERGVPNAGGSATLHPNSPPPLSRTSIASSRTSRSSRTRGSSQDRGDRQDDGNPFKDRFIFTLTDPAMHLLAFRGESGMLDELESDQAGDLGPDGRDAFLSVHQCGDVCRALKLPHNTPFQLQRGGTVRYPDNASELPYAK